MAFADILKTSERFASDNAPAILLGVGVTGTVTTAVLAGRASFKAADIIIAEQFRRRELEGTDDDLGHLDWDNKFPIERIKLVWPLYVPAVATGAVTIGSIVYANRLSARKAAALVAAYGISEKALDDYKAKVLESIGKNKERAVRDAVAQDRVTKAHESDKPIIIVGDGEALFMDSTTGRFFRSTIEQVRAAENKINFEILNYGHASLAKFHSELGLAELPVTIELGWADAVNVEFSTALTPDGQPCIVVEFANQAHPNYEVLGY